VVLCYNIGIYLFGLIQFVWHPEETVTILVIYKDLIQTKTKCKLLANENKWNRRGTLRLRFCDMLSHRWL